MANAIYTIYLAIRIAGVDFCAQNLGNFGVGTNIKSILLTFTGLCEIIVSTHRYLMKGQMVDMGFPLFPLLTKKSGS